MSDTTTLHSLGVYAGHDAASTLTMESAPYDVLAFSSLRPAADSLYGSVASGCLVLELAEAAAVERLQRGFDLIRDSFGLTGRINDWTRASRKPLCGAGASAR